MTGGVRPPALLLAGWSRSGTTMVTRLASELPQVRFPAGESQFFRYCGRGLVLRHGPRPRRSAVRQALGRYRDHWSGSDMGVEPDAVMERLDGARPHIADVYAVVVDLATGGSARPADKSNLNAEWLEVVLDRFATTRAVAVVRDPRAVFVSARELGWLTSPAAFARSWARVQGTLLRLASGPAADRVVLLRYEDVVADPDRVGRVLREALGLEGEARSLDERGAGDAPVLFHPREARWKQRALEPPDPGRADRWRAVLDPGTERVILRHCASAMVASGYGTVSSAVGPAPADRRPPLPAALGAVAERLTDIDERATDRAGVAMVRAGHRRVGATGVALGTRALSIAGQRLAQPGERRQEGPRRPA